LEVLSVTVSNLSGRLSEIMTPFLTFYNGYAEARERAGDDACDFALGNPHDMPLVQFGQTLQRHALPQNKDWFAYKMSEEPSRCHVATALQERYGIPFEPDDICMTTGAAGALSLAFHTLLDPGDEVIINLPPWFFYEAYIAGCHGVTVKVSVKPTDFDLDLDAIRSALTSRTRAIVVNSPNNPTGKIYPAATLRDLAAILTEASERYGRPVYLISDESYSRILFDGNTFMTPTAYYPYSLLIYTYGKTLLTPGQRLGYLALPPAMPDRVPLREALFVGQVVHGFMFPNALMQYSLPDLERLSIDLEDLQHKRDWLAHELNAMGYRTHTPQGTFYLLVRSPLPDDVAFTNFLAERGVFCLPGSVAEIPGYFRISLTANAGMIERALPRFAAALTASAATM
jgi:aspartate aminotransferase